MWPRRRTGSSTGMEAPRLPALVDGLIEIAQTGQGEEALRHVVLDPCGGAQCGVGIALR